MTRLRRLRDCPLRVQLAVVVASILVSALGALTALDVRAMRQRRLADEGVSFSQVLDELKLDLAKRYLQEGVSVSRIAWLLGYREVSAFTHAFKRWTGQSPKQLRQREQAGVADIGQLRRKRAGRPRRPGQSSE